MSDPSQVSRQSRIRDLFEEASLLTGGERSTFLDRACGGDEELRREVSSLLFEAESVDSPIENLVSELIWPALKSLSGDASKLEDWLEDRLQADLEQTDPLIGKTISHFEILEPIGRGGMGMVYRAQDRSLDRVVALKFLPPSLSSDTGAKGRFVHEAKAASGLNHPNIATVYEIGETGDHQLFIAMGYYPGVTLKVKIEHGPMTPEEVIAIAIQLATGLKNAHEHGVIHRDIKPGNIMMTAEGTVVLLDFGLAKLSHESGYTMVGQMMGTIAYMSPEQARGEAVDQRSDIWSFGVVLYELLTGRPPFGGDNVQTVIRAILEEDPEPPILTDRKGSESIEAVLGLCLSKDPVRRYPNAGELLEDLQRVRDGLAPKKRGGRATWHRRKRRWPSVLAGAVGVGALISAILIFGDRPASSTNRPTPVVFTAVTEGPLVEAVGFFGAARWIDFDDDGYLDLTLVENDRVTGAIHFYHNNGDATFSLVTDGAPDIGTARPFDGSWVDQDNDGDLDLFVTTDSDDPNLFYRQGPPGVFSRVSEGGWVETPGSVHSVAWGDYDNDGWIDLFVASADEASLKPNRLYHNQGDLTMEAVESDVIGIPGISHGCLWTDYDGDGDVDLFVAGQERIQFRNEGNGVFAWVPPDYRGIPEYTRDVDIGFSSADYDNDGDLDIGYAVWGDGSGVLLYRNELRNTFNDLSHLLPYDGQVRSLGPTWGDYDNDGNVDLFISNYIGRNLLYHNEGGDHFTLVTDSPVVSASLSTGGAIWGDYDNDGDLDLFVTNGLWDKFGQSCELYRNEGGPNHWIVIKLKGTVSNRSAIGTKVWVKARIRGGGTTQMRELQMSGGADSSAGQRIHFGLGDATTIDTLRIEWPSGLVQEMHDVAADQFLTTVEEGG